MIGHSLRLQISLVAAVLAILVGSAVAYATEEPSSTPSITNIKVNRYLMEDGDVLIYGDYNIPYTSLPDEAADETYIFRLFDGTTELGAVSPFCYFDRGYNKGVFSFYFAEGNDIEWGESYIIRISQSPAFFESPESWDFTIPSSAYTTNTEQEDNQDELAVNIIASARRLETYYSDYILLEDSAGGTVLSSPTGENYFRGAIYGIQAMAPDLFLIQVLPVDTTAREWTTEQFDQYAARFEGTWVGEETEAGGQQFGITNQMFMAVLFILPICIGAIIVSAKKFKHAEPGFVFSILALTMGVLMGWVPGALYAFILQLMSIYLAYVWFYARG